MIDEACIVSKICAIHNANEEAVLQKNISKWSLALWLVCTIDRSCAPFCSSCVMCCSYFESTFFGWTPTCVRLGGRKYL